VVNGPGEARETDIGITGGGTLANEGSANKVYISGVADHNIGNAAMIDHVVALVEKKAAEIEAAKAAEKADKPAAE
jgi:(E)-4-hydroxy-3-methylbut-2-enyl-diphosphate synthase